MSEIKLNSFNHSETIKLNRPYMVLRLDGSCYINKKVASLLNLNHGDALSFSCTDDQQNWYIANDEHCGATVNKNGGLFRFCDLKLVRKVFNAYQMNDVKKAFFPISDKLEEIDGKKYLFVIPKPYNIEKAKQSA